MPQFTRFCTETALQRPSLSVVRGGRQPHPGDNTVKQDLGEKPLTPRVHLTDPAASFESVGVTGRYNFIERLALKSISVAARSQRVRVMILKPHRTLPCVVLLG